MVEAEIVLDGDGGQRLRLALDGDLFLRLDRLVQAVAPAAAGHLAARIFVHDDDLVVLDHILHVLLIEAIGLEELGDRVDALRLGLIFLVKLRLGLRAFAHVGFRLRAVVNFVQRRAQVGQHEGVRVFRAEEIAAFLRQICLVALFVNGEEKLLLLRVHLHLFLIGVKLQLRLVHQPEILRVLEKLHQAGGLGLADLHSIQQQADFALQSLAVRSSRGVLTMELAQQLFGFREEPVAQPFLGLVQRLDLRLEHAVLIVISDDRRAADDQRRARFINQDRVHLVHDGEVMPALDLVFFALGHAVVAQVIEPELGVGAVSDVVIVLLAPHARRLVVQDAAHRQAQKLIHRAHPFAVARSQIVVDGDHVNASARERIEINRQRGHQRLAFARGHFRDSTRMQRITADELHVEGDHFPLERVAANCDLGPAQAAAGVLDHPEGLGQKFVKTLGQLGVVLDFGQFLLPGSGFLAQRLFRQRLQLGLEGVDFFDQRP